MDRLDRPLGRPNRAILSTAPRTVESPTGNTVRALALESLAGNRAVAGAIQRQGAPETEYELRTRESQQEMGILPGFERVYAHLHEEARSRGQHMSWERWQQIQADGDLATQWYGELVRSLADEARDSLLENVLRVPESVTHGVGGILTLATGLQLVYDEAQWNHPNADEARRYRTTQMYAYLTWQLAHRLAEGDTSLARRLNSMLVSQTLSFLEWKVTYGRRLQEWVEENVPESERAPSIGRPSIGAWPPTR